MFSSTYWNTGLCTAVYMCMFHPLLSLVLCWLPSHPAGFSDLQHRWSRGQLVSDVPSTRGAQGETECGGLQCEPDHTGPGTYADSVSAPQSNT